MSMARSSSRICFVAAAIRIVSVVRPADSSKLMDRTSGVGSGARLSITKRRGFST
jgi:hypothetical protein